MTMASSSGVRWFCHEDSFGLDEAWNSPEPVFSSCFYNSVLYMPLVLYVALYVPLRVIHLLLHPKLRTLWSPGPRPSFSPPSWNIISGSQLLFMAILLLISSSKLMLMLWQSNWSLTAKPPVTILSHLFETSTFMMAVIFICWHRKLAIHTSPSLAFLSLFYSIASSFHLVLTFSQHSTFSQHEIYLIYAQFATSVCNVISQCFSTHRPSNYTRLEESTASDDGENGQSNPYLYASVFSKLTFQWTSRLVILGWKKGTLSVDDIPEMIPNHRACYIHSKFNRIWAKLRNSSALLIHNDAISTVNTSLPQTGGSIDEPAYLDDSINENTIVTSDQQPIIAPVDEEPAIHQEKKGNVFIAACKAYGGYFSVAIIASLLLDLCVLTTPIVLRSLLSHLEDTQHLLPWHGYLIVLALFSVTQMQSLLQNFFYYRILTLAVMIRSALVSMIYRKSLRTANVSRGESSTGQVVTLMSVDADRFTNFVSWCDVLWSAPLRICVSIYFIYQELGFAVFAGVAVVIILIPFTTVLSKYMQRLQKAQMKQKDERIKLINELLNGIKVIKLYAWEKSFTKLIQVIRNVELSKLRRMVYSEALTLFIYSSTPMLVALSTFLTYSLSDASHHLDAKKAFVSLAFFNIMRMPLTNLPFMFIQVATLRVSISRLNKFLNLPELRGYVSHNVDKYAVRITRGNFSHGKGVSLDEEKDEKKKKSQLNGTLANGNTSSATTSGAQDASETFQPFELKNINLKVKEGTLVAIVGQVGSGKSSLISSILGEMDITSGSVNIAPGNSIAYVPQQAWIQNNTLKNNILFGQPYSESKYRKIITACQLLPDLAVLPSGDETEIGEKGINLSGGQKQRLALARACYNNAKLYILDDPLSAVDAHVGKNLYNQIFSTQTGLLGSKTRILVTNDITILPKVDHIYVMVNGSISESGKYDQLMAAKGKFAEFVSEFSHKKEQSNSRASSPEPSADGAQPNLERSSSRISGETSQDSESLKKKKEDARLITEEQLNTGKVELKVYWAFLRNISLIFIPILCLMITQGLDAGNNYWLSLWASDGNSTDPHLATLRVSVYGGLGLSQMITILIGAMIFARGTVICASNMHSGLLQGILRAPMSFFDTTPSGRIVNRFSKDIDMIDAVLPDSFQYWLLVVIQSVATFSVIIIVMPSLALIIVPITVVYYFIQKVYVPTNRQLRRILSVTRSPLYSNFSETLTGVSTIRAYRAQARFIKDSDRKLDVTQSASFAAVSTNRWLSVRLQFVGNCIITCTGLFSALYHGSMSPALAGLSVTYAMSITQILNWLIMMTAGLETNIVSVERVLEFTHLESEAEWESPDALSKPPVEWPSQGTIEFKSFSTRYREGLDLVLKNISFRIDAREKIGVVGRTGAGKSSVTLSLFRIIEPASGTIMIDDVDISTIGLHELRNALTIIPQDPVLFSGKLRINLDPFGRFTDDELWRSLELAHLKEFASGLEGGLDYIINEGGSNLSVGQRQLVCLARALLKKTKILILDEATAAVDLQTDSLIQSTVRSEFSDCTILTIAHRLNTILDSDRILVFDKGEVVEFAPPKVLLEDKDSQFYSLARDAGVV